MIQSTASRQAKAYFSNALSKADYFINDVELQGKFFGKLCGRLGIGGTASKDVFFALCDNRHPLTGDKLTPRDKANRTTGYDISFHAPKSVSIAHVLSGDNKILGAFETAVRETMTDIERAAKTRVRKNGVYDDRATGELVWAEFIHQTARSAGDKLTPDMHLHAHNYVFNLAFDPEEQRFKAGKFREIMQHMPGFQASFHKRFADELVRLGFQIRKTTHSFELAAVPEQLIRHFSKRTDQIGRVAKEKGITDAKALDKLGALTRSKKQQGLSLQELRTEWLRQMDALSPSSPETETVIKPGVKQKQTLIPEFAKPLVTGETRRTNDRPHTHTAQDCLEHAVQHSFERASVVADTILIAEACKFAMGNPDVTVDQIREALKNDNRIITIQRGTKKLCTTKDVLMEEKRMVNLASSGIGKRIPLYRESPAFRGLNEQQAKALGSVLTTPNRVSIIRGGAGTGKTTLMKEARHWIGRKGKQIIAVAPTAEASRGVLRQDGFDTAETVARLLQDKHMQDSIKGQVLWVDEAGLLSGKQMVDILELATKQKAQLVLSGDTKQHRSVLRGDALRILSTIGNIKPAEVSRIMRQKNSLYLQAVHHLGKGNVEVAFDRLDDMGAIKTYDRTDPHGAMVKDYLNAVRRGKSTLVISPTHQEGRKTTKAIREALRKGGRIGKKETPVRQMTNLGLTEAEKKDARTYERGQVIQFNQNHKGINRGSSWTVRSVKEGEVLLTNTLGHVVALPLDKASRFDVFTEDRLSLSRGDMVRLTRNGFDKKNQRIDNGMTLKVRSVSEDGSVIVQHPISKKKFYLDPSHGHIDHAYCLTSHAAQGKTVDEVFIVQPAATFGATDLKQFYVSVSRGKEAVHLYTDDKKLLMEYAAELGDRQSALELVGKSRDRKTLHDKHRNHQAQVMAYNHTPKEKARDFYYNKTDIDFEPVP